MFVCGMRRCTSADLVLMILDLFCYHKIWPIESREYADTVIIRSRIDANQGCGCIGCSIAISISDDRLTTLDICHIDDSLDVVY